LHCNHFNETQSMINQYQEIADCFTSRGNIKKKPEIWTKGDKKGQLVPILLNCLAKMSPKKMIFHPLVTTRTEPPHKYLKIKTKLRCQYC
jgi:hypothetical protein